MRFGVPVRGVIWCASSWYGLVCRFINVSGSINILTTGQVGRPPSPSGLSALVSQSGSRQVLVQSLYTYRKYGGKV